MKIAYIGKISFSALIDCGRWERLTASGGWVVDERGLSRQKWGFYLGSMIIKGLLNRGHEVHIISAEPEDVCGRFRCHVNGENRYRLTVTFVPESPKTRWMYLRFFWKEMVGMRRAIKELKPEVCFAQWTYENAYAGLTSGYPTLVVAHDSPWNVFKAFRNLQTLIKAVYATFLVVPKIKRMTVVSPYIADEFKKFRRFRHSDITVIPNGIEMLRDPPSLKLWRTSESGGTREHPPTIVCISQAGRLKNSSALFTAWEILKPKHPDWVLKVYGQGMPQGMVSREELDRVLREEADLFVSPSLEESFGMVFVEAMRFGVPCIGGEKSGAVPWVVGEGGVVCDVTKPEKLAECIERVMGDKELRKKLGDGGRQRVREMFDIEKVVDMYERELVKAK